MYTIFKKFSPAVRNDVKIVYKTGNSKSPSKAAKKKTKYELKDCQWCKKIDTVQNSTYKADNLNVGKESEMVMSKL